MVIIIEFRHGFEFLSNFWIVEIENEGLVFPSVEHAFQAAKTLNKEDKLIIQAAVSPRIAKRIGRVVTLRKDWEEVKFDVMLNLLRKKFSVLELRQKLIDTDDAVLQERNNWNDRIWGICNGKGENNLGKLLMQVRTEVKGVR